MLLVLLCHKLSTDTYIREVYFPSIFYPDCCILEISSGCLPIKVFALPHSLEIPPIARFSSVFDNALLLIQQTVSGFKNGASAPSLQDSAC